MQSIRNYGGLLLGLHEKLFWKGTPAAMRVASVNNGLIECRDAWLTLTTFG